MKSKSTIATLITFLPRAAILGLLLVPRMVLSAASISCGQTVTNTTTIPTHIDQYSFAGTAGQVVSIAFSWTSGSGGTADIYTPSGQIWTNVLADSNGGHAINVTLPASGTYTILVHSDLYSVTATYRLSIQSPTGGGCNSTPIACGQTVSTNTSSITEMDAYGFDTCGGTVIFTFSGYSGARLDLYDPTGNKMLTITPGTGPSTNLVAGIYTLIEHDVNYAGAGSYGFTATCIGGGGYVINPTRSEERRVGKEG